MNVLPDVLKPALKVVFCGTAVGTESAQASAYYAKPGNQFWGILHHIGLTPRRLAPQEYPTLLQYGVGLTDLVKTRFGADSSLSLSDFDCEGLHAKILQYKPKVLAFNGKRAAKAFYDRRRVDYGRQAESIGETVVFVLPSTSGAARRYWEESYWKELADFLEKEAD